ncbi:auxin response factor 2-like isoform X1 [Typha angustifolia]|uniref:auxin response factor 2-like isoform X1 n=1 Tax=Typha angustifolia TaxID=59011 RepID=UPI003C2EAAA4
MGIDLNTVEEEEEEEAEAPPASGGVCLELWHACAGPLISLPRKGSVVVYLPQGHLEHLGDEGGGGFGRCDVPPHVFCRVVDVKLHADADTDEVYAQLSLVAESEDFERRLNEDGIEGDEEIEEADEKRKSSMPHMFCKTLTASDTSTHGGFSVPRRAAEDCFPALDHGKQRPSQELVAKDLHGLEWRFRHIYRGQPRRHLLTTGWSAFVNKKKLVSGDAVLFLRGDDGDLRLGVRRTVQLKNGTPCAAHYSPRSYIDSLATVYNAVSMKSVFHIYYNPRASSSEYIVPYWKFVKSLSHPFSVGTRFKMRYESEDAADRRNTGLITGIADMDPTRWPGSKWRCLLVRWDDMDCRRQNRVSPWEIEPTGSVSGYLNLSSSSKRTKIGLSTPIPFLNGNGPPGFGESSRFHKVLQGQELMGFITHDSVDVASRATQATEVRFQYPDIRCCSTDVSSCMLGAPKNGVGLPAVNSVYATYPCTGFGESIRCQKVLQGQEIFPTISPLRGTFINGSTRTIGFGPFDDVHASSRASRCTAPVQGYVSLGRSSLPSAQASSPSSVLMFQQSSFKKPNLQSLHSDLDKDEDSNQFDKLNSLEMLGKKCQTLPYWPHYLAGEVINNHLGNGEVFNSLNFVKQGLNDRAIGGNGFRLFGFPLTERVLVTNEEGNYETCLPTSKPRMCKSLECTCTSSSALCALRAAPL